MESYIVMIGDPVEGFVFNGPFGNHEDAEVFAERYGKNAMGWYICELLAPTEDDE